MWKCLPQLSSSAYLGFLVWDKWLFALIVARWCTNITFTNVISWFMIHTCPREDLRHPWSPIWDSRSFALVFCRRLWGMIHVSPLKTIPSTTDNSSRMLKNGWMTVGVPSFESVNQDYGLEFLQLVIWNWEELRCINMLYFDSSVCVSYCCIRKSIPWSLLDRTTTGFLVIENSGVWSVHRMALPP